MDYSQRVKLRRRHHLWESASGDWSMQVRGTIAIISAPIVLIPGITIDQTCSCVEFNQLLGGVFHPNSIDPGNGGALQPPIVPVDLLVT